MLIIHHPVNFRCTRLEPKDMVNLAFHEVFERRHYLPEPER
jgi:hypothetical protein